ncbi:hypothetical protein AO262_25245 [Pseudomonas fluorescens ABAC62]|nr:hypothetical protein AO262_25245 [Pseudomonas fluorescens ABAC62]
MGRLVRRIENLDELPNTFFTKAETLKATDAANFNSGYQTGKPEAISGYSPSMSVSELQELGLQRGRSTEELGCLFKQIELKTLALNQQLAIKFNNEIRAAGGTVNLMPQGYYLSQVKPISPGQCAALSNTMAYAIQEGKEATLIENFFTAIAHPEHANTQNFRNKLQSYQSTLRTNFHGTQATRNITYSQIIDELAGAKTSKCLLIGNKKHGICAGVTVKDGQKEWFYYDPNFGLAKFPTEEAMRNGVDRTLNSGSTRHLFRPDPESSTYSVSVFNELDMMNTDGTPLGAYTLFAKPIVVPSPKLSSTTAVA